MLFQTFRNRSNLPFAVRAHQESSDKSDRRRFCEEKSWRCLADTENDGASDADILVSRWTKSGVACQHEKTIPSIHRHVIGVALKATRVKLARGSSTVFD